MVYIVLMVTASFALSISYRRCPLHPLFWMPIFLAIYGSWYYLFLVSSGFEVGTQDLLGVKYHLLAMLAFSIPCAVIVPRNVFNDRSLHADGFALDKIIGIIFVCLLMLYLLYVLVSGASSKREIKDQLEGGASLVAALSVIGVTLMAVRAVACKFFCRRQKTLSVLTYIVFAIIAFLLIGEREIIFGISLIWFLAWKSGRSGNRNFIHFYAMISVGIFAVAASQGLKASVVGQINWDRVVFETVFRSEFAAPGRNFRYLEFVNEEDLVGWRVVATEVQRFALSIVPGLGSESVSQWFNKTYRHDLGVDGSSGWGFTMVGSAYLAGGAVGVFFYYFFIGLGVSTIIQLGKRSDIMLISYFCIIPILIYATRQDLSYMLNYYFKFALMFNLVVHMSSRALLTRFPRARSGRGLNDATL